MLTEVDCYCGNILAYTTPAPIIDSACSTICPGNSSEICGGESLLSIFSAEVPVVQAMPVSPSIEGPFDYLGCYTEASSGRALPLARSTTTDMTVEECANFCAGYNAFGVEYSAGSLQSITVALR